MNDAPERIWATPSKHDCPAGFLSYSNSLNGGTEYVRADLWMEQCRKVALYEDKLRQWEKREAALGCM